MAWREREIAAGRCEEPPEPWEVEGPAVSLSLGDAADVDPGLLAAICGPDGLDGERARRAVRAGRGGGRAAARPAAGGAGRGGVRWPAAADRRSAGRRAARGAAAGEPGLLPADAGDRGVRPPPRRGARGREGPRRPRRLPGRGVPLVELASELLVSRVEAGRLLESATSLATRLPRSLQGMADGLIDAERAAIIAAYTGCLRPEDAARADEILAAAAPEVRAETLARRAAALLMKLDPQAAERRKDSARRAGRRVEVKLERSGNSCVAGRELDIADALASKANIHATALRLRRAGVDGSLDHLRAAVFSDLLQGRNPFDRLAPVPKRPPMRMNPLTRTHPLRIRHRPATRRQRPAHARRSGYPGRAELAGRAGPREPR